MFTYKVSSSSSSACPVTRFSRPHHRGVTGGKKGKQLPGVLRDAVRGSGRRGRAPEEQRRGVEEEGERAGKDHDREPEDRAPILPEDSLRVRLLQNVGNKGEWFARVSSATYLYAL